MNKKLLAVAIGAALAVAGNAHALEAKLSGQVNRAIMYADDGFNTELHHVDNANSGTRFRFTGNDTLVGSTKAGINIEMEYLSDASNAVTQTAKNSDPGLHERIIEAYFEGSFGKVSLGQGSGAGDGAIEVDISGTAAASYSGTMNNLGGALTFRDTAAGVGPTISSTTSNFDPSRKDRVRYDTPRLGPVVLSVSNGNDTNDSINEFGVWFDQDFGGNKLSAAAMYTDEDMNSVTTGHRKNKGLSASWLASFGLSVTGAWAKREDKNIVSAAQLDASFKYLKVGYKFGEHAVSMDWGKTEDLAAKGDESKMLGVQYVYSPTKWADLYANINKHTLDRTGGTAVGTGTAVAATSYEDIKMATVGTRLKF